MRPHLLSNIMQMRSEGPDKTAQMRSLSEPSLLVGPTSTKLYALAHFCNTHPADGRSEERSGV